MRFGEAGAVISTCRFFMVRVAISIHPNGMFDHQDETHHFRGMALNKAGPYLLRHGARYKPYKPYIQTHMLSLQASRGS